jgi:hypothetical protein
MSLAVQSRGSLGYFDLLVVALLTAFFPLAASPLSVPLAAVFGADPFFLLLS